MSSPAYLLIDSGTTRTRARLSDGRRVLAQAAAQAGARDTAVDGHNGRLRAALGELVRELTHGEPVAAIIASGMITSNLGLYEVPHLPAPAGPAELGAAMVVRQFPEIAPQPIHFIPGVKSPAAGWEDLPAGDILRGEEAEVTGLRSLLEITGGATFVHYGSHHKAIRTDAAGRILGSETTLTGELLQAVSAHTILASSVLPPGEVALDEEAWRQGLALALAEGIGRALFATRLTQQMLGRDRQVASSFLLGALTAMDLPMVERARQRGDRLILYGGDQFPQILQRYLEAGESHSTVQRVEPVTAELAAVAGAVAIYRQHGRATAN